MNASFEYVRPQTAAEIPSPSVEFVDVAVLDMNHAHHNAGHDSMVGLVQRLSSDLAPSLAPLGARVRLTSYDVRRRSLLPPLHDGPSLILGTGGPGRLDPRLNRRDAVDEGEILESPEWESPLFEFFDAVDRHPSAMLYAVCHSFGLLCRWSGIAHPVARGENKGGPSIGIVDNVLTQQALEHPWFGRLASHLPDGKHLPVVDSRHYDLLPVRQRFPRGVVPIAFETQANGDPGEALTMVEFARKPNGTPRILAVNHHPEIPNAADLAELLRRKLREGEVSQDWYAGRAALVDRLQRNDHSEPARLLAAGYSFAFLVRDGLKDLIEDRRRRRGRTVSRVL